MVVELTTEKEVAFVPPNFTTVAPVKLVPVIVIVAPVPAVAGEKEDMEGVVGAGGGTTVVSFLQDDADANTNAIMINLFMI